MILQFTKTDQTYSDHYIKEHISVNTVYVSLRQVFK
jgi:hypothetical protein